MQPSDVLIRPCTVSDLDALEAWLPTGNSRTHAMRFSHQEAGTSTYYLATGYLATGQDATEEFIGSCELRWDGCAAREVPRCPEVNGLQVWPATLRSRGIGTQMLALLEREAREHGHHTLGLGVGDPRPKRLYERLGYEDTGQDYLDRYVWVDEHHAEHPVAERCRWMMKPLSGGRLEAGRS